MADIVKDSSEVQIPTRADSANVRVPTSTADKADISEHDRSATQQGRKGPPVLLLVGGIGLVAAILAASLFSTPQLGSSVEEQDKATAIDMEYGNLADTAAVDLPADGMEETPERIAELEDDNRDRVADDREAERNARLALLRERQSRELAIQAERQQRIDAAFAQQRAREQSPVMILGGSSGGVALPGRGQASAPSAPSGAGSAAAATPATFNDNLNASSIARVSASRMPNRNFSIEAGTNIGCTLQSAIDSTLSGLVTCILPRDVRSATGQVVLLEKGTKVLGEYQGGIRQGEARIFIVWNRAVSPKGISVNLVSPATDTLGRSGVAGDVETFFWKRFGGALLLSLVGDAGSALSNRASGVRETTTAPNDAATAALESDINIRPVLRAPQGTQLAIVAARDMDFSGVYSLRLRR